MLFDDGYQKIDYESLSSELWDNNDDESRLPPEPSLGNVEYKLKLINPTDIRFERLVSQVDKKSRISFVYVARTQNKKKSQILYTR